MVTGKVAGAVRQGTTLVVPFRGLRNTGEVRSRERPDFGLRIERAMTARLKPCPDESERAAEPAALAGYGHGLRSENYFGLNNFGEVRW